MLKRCSTALFALWSAGMLAGADGGVTGYGRYPKLIDRPALGYVQMYEWNLFLSPLGGTIVGPSPRLRARPARSSRLRMLLFGSRDLRLAGWL